MVFRVMLEAPVRAVLPVAMVFTGARAAVVARVFWVGAVARLDSALQALQEAQVVQVEAVALVDRPAPVVQRRAGERAVRTVQTGNRAITVAMEMSVLQATMVSAVTMACLVQMLRPARTWPWAQ